MAFIPSRKYKNAPKFVLWRVLTSHFDFRIWGTDVSLGETRDRFRRFLRSYRDPNSSEDTLNKYLRLIDQV